MQEMSFFEEIKSFSYNLFLSVSWREMRFWVVLEENDRFSLVQQV